MRERLLLDKREAAWVIGVSPRTIDALIANRELPVRRIGRRVLVHRNTLEKFAQQNHTTRKNRTHRAGLIETAGVPPL